jgi:hypothetical protein
MSAHGGKADLAVGSALACAGLTSNRFGSAFFRPQSFRYRSLCQRRSLQILLRSAASSPTLNPLQPEHRFVVRLDRDAADRHHRPRPDYCDPVPRWVKMLNDIEVLDQPDSNYWTKVAYTVPDTPHASIKPGETDAKMIPINRMVPRSFVTNIASGRKVDAAAPTTLRGIAFGGDCGVASVDFSIDRGQPRRMSGRLLST